jgi:hypothetical protein
MRGAITRIAGTSSEIEGQGGAFKMEEFPGDVGQYEKA